VKLKMEAHFEPDVQSANVIGEIVGRETPEEVVVVGGHFDSWDVGAGASDDGGGCVVTWEALRLMKKAGLRPRRTMRVVLFTNEENGLRGGRAYLEKYRDQLANHVLMFESDLESSARPDSTSAERRGPETIKQMHAPPHRRALRRAERRRRDTPAAGRKHPRHVPGREGNIPDPQPRRHRRLIDPIDAARNAAAIAVMTYDRRQAGGWEGRKAANDQRRDHGWIRT
jgi:carboxypeptidase Q